MDKSPMSLNVNFEAKLLKESRYFSLYINEKDITELNNVSCY